MIMMTVPCLLGKPIPSHPCPISQPTPTLPLSRHCLSPQVSKLQDSLASRGPKGASVNREAELMKNLAAVLPLMVAAGMRPLPAAAGDQRTVASGMTEAQWETIQ